MCMYHITLGITKLELKDLESRVKTYFSNLAFTHKENSNIYFFKYLY